MVRICHLLAVVLAFFLSQLEPIGFGSVARAQGSFNQLDTNAGEVLITETVGFSFETDTLNPSVRMKLGFATDEVFQAGTIFDSFSVTLQSLDSMITLILATMDASGVVWAPPTPGAVPLEIDDFQITPFNYPSLSPELSTREAFDLEVRLPSEVTGHQFTAYFDLFNNENGSESQAFFQDFAVVPEPNVLLLLGIGLAGLVLVRKKKSLRGASRASVVLAMVLAVFASASRSSAQVEQTFQLNGADITLAEATPDVEIFYVSMRLNRALNVWNVEVTATNRSNRVLTGPLVLMVDSFIGTTGVEQPDGITSSGKSFYDLSTFAEGGSLAPGQGTTKRTMALGLGSGSPALTTRFFVARPAVAAALGVTRSLNGVGQPLPGVMMDIGGPTDSEERQSDAPSGVASFGIGPGEHVVKFSTDDHLPVWRTKVLLADQTTVVPNPKLVRRSSNGIEVSPLGGVTVSNRVDTVRIDIDAGAVSQNATVTVTGLNGQNLPAFLPLGWSPLNAFWFESSVPLTSDISAELQPLGSVDPTENIALVKWNEVGLRWLVTQILPGNGEDPVTVILNGTGAYALVVGDSGATAPPVPQIAQPLNGFDLVAPVDPANLTVRGEVVPGTSPASVIPERVTGMAELEIRDSSDPLPSGYLLRGEVTGTFLLSDGSLRLTPQYEQFIVGYQRPGDSDPNSLHARFPMRPLLLFGTDRLDEATIRMDVLPEEPFDGEVLDDSGGQLSADGVRILAGSGRLTGPSALRLRRLDFNIFTNLMSEGFSAIGAFDLTVDRSTLGDALAAQLSGAPADALFVLARVLSDEGFYGLQPIERLATDANGNFSSLEPDTGERLPGLRGSGQYVLIRVQEPQGLVSGVATNGTGQPQAGMPVRLTGLPWLTLTDETGRYQLLAPAGDAEVGVSDPLTGDTGFAAVNVADPGIPVSQDLGTAPAGPRVASITPDDGEVKVPRVGSVVVRFNEAVNPGTVVEGAIQLLKPDDSVVTAALSLNLANTVATLSPANELEANTNYRVRLASTIADPTGLPIDGALEFSFTTVPLSTRIATAQLVIYEPGATNVPAAILDDIPAFTPGDDPFAIVVHGQPGVADSDVPVVLVNESTGETQTILSKLDGSFSSFISGTEEDFVSATFVNLNGTRIYVPVSRQEFDDGFVGLYPQGGVLEAESDGGPVRVLLEPGSIEDRQKIRVGNITAPELLTLIGDTQPESGMLLGGVRYEETGGGLKAAADISFPIQVAQLGLPAGTDPATASFALTIPQQLNGTTVYQVVDEMVFVDEGNGSGRVETRSPPYVGLLLRQLRDMQKNTLVPDALGSVSVSDADDGEVKTDGLFGFIFTGAGKGTTIAGKTISGQVDGTGGIVGDKRPVAGAIVAFDFAGAEREPGNFREGEMVGVSDRQGRFAFFLTPLSGGLGRELVATHPRFPFQLARSPGFNPGIADTTAVNVELPFALPTVNAAAFDGIAPPIVYASHSPAVPTIGSSTHAGTVVQVLASDDKQIVTVDLLVDSVRATGDDSTLSLTNVLVDLLDTEQPFPTRFISTYRVRSSIPVRAVLTARATDDFGNTTDSQYPLAFGVSYTPVDPVDPNDTTGPRVFYSWPPKLAGAIPSLSPVVIRFNEPIQEQWLDQTTWDWITMDAAHTIQTIEPSDDFKEITIYYEGDTDGEVELTISPPLTDVNGNEFDQLPSETGSQSYTLRFEQAGLISGNLPGVQNGGGVVLGGGYAFALERINSEAGRVLAFDLEDPGSPQEQDHEFLEGWPTTLQWINDYSMPIDVDHTGGTPSSWNCEEHSWLAVTFGGASETKRLAVVPVYESLLGGPLHAPVTGPLSQSPASMITESRWDAPLFGYLESGADVTSVNLLNLPAFHIAYSSNGSFRDALPEDGFAGEDVNLDGDYCDVDLDEKPPLPRRSVNQVLGLEFSWAPPSARERIEAFDFSADFGLLAAVTRNLDGEAPRFRVLLDGSGVLDEENILELTGNERPKRVRLLPGTEVETNSTVVIRDLALVTYTGNPGRIDVIDITVPTLPVLASTIDLPSGEGSANTIQVREDGLLVLSTANSHLLLNPRKLLDNSNTSLQHPALIGSLDELGSGVRDFTASLTGINLVNASSKNQLIQSEPGFAVLRFEAEPKTAVDIAALDKGELYSLMDKGRSVSLAQVTPLDFGQAPADPDPLSHYYALMYAPGGAGDEVDLALASLDASGKQQRMVTGKILPTVIADEGVTAVHIAAAIIKRVLKFRESFTGGGVNDMLVAFFQVFLSDILEFYFGVNSYPSKITAHRLSDDPTSDLYNRYLAGPFVVARKGLDESKITQLQNQLERAYLRAGSYFWVGVAPEESDNLVLGRFASRLELNPNFVSFNPAGLPGTDDIVAAVALSGSSFGIVQFGGLFNSPFILNGDLDPVLLPGANQIVPVAFESNPVIVIPGVMGSHLELLDTRAWVKMSPSLIDVDEDGNSLNDIVSSDPLRRVPDIVGKKIYGGLIDYLTEELGYVEYNYKVGSNKSEWIKNRSLTNGVPPLPVEEPVPNLFVYPYDWRLDNAASAADLEKYVELVLALHPETEKVDLLAHSMGGVVSRRFVLDNPGKVGKLVSVGTPWLGAPKALAAMKTGDFDEFVMNLLVGKQRLRNLAVFMKSLHQLLPSKGMFDMGIRPVFEAGWDVDENGTAYESYDYGTYTNVLENYLFADELEEFGMGATNSPSARNHVEFQHYNGEDFGDWTSDDTGVQYFHLVGVQSIPRTIGRVAFSTWFTPVIPTNNDVVLDTPAVEYFDSEQPSAEDLLVTVDPEEYNFPDGTNQFKLQRNVEALRVAGDGTVPLASSARGFGSDLSLNAPGARVYAIASTRMADNEHADHNGMLNNRVTHKLLSRILDQAAPTPITVEITGPGTSQEGATVSFSATHQPPDDVQGTPTYLWDFGDGLMKRDSAGATSSSATHVFDDDGTYVVTCVVVYSDGQSGINSRAVIVNNLDPTVSIDVASTTVVAGSTRELVATVTDPGILDTHRFRWDLDGDGDADDQDGGFVAIASYPTVGMYTNTVLVRDKDGGTAEDTIVITATASAPAVQGFLGRPIPRPQEDPPVAIGEPHLYIRFSGHKHGGLAGDGVRVNDDGSVSYLADLLSALANPLTGGIEFKKAAAGIFADEGSEEDIFVNVWRRDESPQNSTRFDFDGTGIPVTVDAYYLEGGEAQKFASWAIPTDSGDDLKLTFDWETEGFVLEKEGTMQVPLSVETGDSARDKNGPAVAGVINGWSRETFLVARDNITPEAELSYYFALDADADGRYLDEIFRPLTNRVFYEASAITRGMGIVARDRAGNISDLIEFDPEVTRDFTYSYVVPPSQGGGPSLNAEGADYCDNLQEIRDTVLAVITDGLALPVVGKFLLTQDHVWFLEQGSGACLWKDSACDGCNGVYKPRKSDNDYEVFFPLFVSDPLSMSTEDRQRFIDMDPHLDSTMTGDWYFRRPQQLDFGNQPTDDLNATATFVYRLPRGVLVNGSSEIIVNRTITDDNLSSGFSNPYTPAELIALAITKVVTGNSDYREKLPDTSFFPFRREHFMYGIMSLERPPPFGDDPIGDAGMGRQMLLLKWVLEGAYVQFGQGSSLNSGVPDLGDVFDNLKLAGVPLVEGFEWGVYQDYAALQQKVGLFLEETEVTSPAGSEVWVNLADGLNKKNETLMKKAGKAAIRSVLARLAGDTNRNNLVLSVSPLDYAAQGYSSFEGAISAIAEKPEAQEAFGSFSADIDQFLRAKLADEKLFEEIRENDEVEEFILKCLRFVRENVQFNTKNSYLSNLVDLASHNRHSERNRRLENFNAVEYGFTAPTGDSFAGRKTMLGKTVEDFLIPYDFNVALTHLGEDAPGSIVLALLPGTGVNQSTNVSLGADGTVVFKGSAKETNIFFFKRSVKDADLKEGSFALVSPSVESPGLEINNRIDFSHRIISADIPEVDLQDYFSIEAYLVDSESIELSDWPALNGRPRSPRFVIHGEDRLKLRIQATPGMGSITASVNSSVDAGSFVVNLDEIAPGLYETPPADQLQFGNDPTDSDRVYVRDEDLLTLSVPSGDSPKMSRSILIDVGELAVATVRHNDRLDTIKPRLDYWDKLVFQSPSFQDAGYSEFPDEVASVVQGGDNAMRQFIVNFADPGRPEVGEADFLYVHLHGDRFGRLYDHTTNSAVPSSDKMVLDPGLHLAPVNAWKTDAEYFISEACAMLNPGLDTDQSPLPGTNGRQRWTQALQNAQKPPHGLMGYAYGKTASRPATQDFLDRIKSSERIRLAWQESMNSVNIEWATLFYASATNDTLREVSQDPLGTDPIIYRNYVGILDDSDCSDDPDGCGVGFDNNPLVEGRWWVSDKITHLEERSVSILPVATIGQGSSRLMSSGKVGAYYEEGRRGDSTLQIKTVSVDLGDVKSVEALAKEAVADSFTNGSVQLKFLGLGQVQEQVISADGEDDPVVVRHVAQFQQTLHDLPILDHFVTVEIDEIGVARISARRGAETVEDAKSTQILRLPSLEALLSRPADAETSPQVIVKAERGWVLDRNVDPTRLVPCWRLHVRTADGSGVPHGLVSTRLIHAQTGADVEVQP